MALIRWHWAAAATPCQDRWLFTTEPGLSFHSFMPSCFLAGGFFNVQCAMYNVQWVMCDRSSAGSESENHGKTVWVSKYISANWVNVRLSLPKGLPPRECSSSFSAKNCFTTDRFVPTGFCLSCVFYSSKRYCKTCCKEYHLHAVHLLYEIVKGHLLFCGTVGVRWVFRFLCEHIRLSYFIFFPQ